MSILTVILAIVVLAVVMWAVNTYIPMEPTLKRILNIVVVIIVIVWLLRVSGLLASLGAIRF